MAANAAQVLTHDFSAYDTFLAGIVVTDESDRILYANPSSMELLKMSPTAVRRKTSLHKFETLVHLSIVEGCDKLTEMSYGKGKDKTNILGSRAPLVLSDGTFANIFYLHDISVESRLHNKYQAQLQEKKNLIDTLQITKAKLATGCLLFLYMIFGFEFLSQKVALDYFPPIFMGSLLAFLPGLFISLFCRYTADPKQPEAKIHPFRILLTSLVYNVVPLPLTFWALHQLPSGFVAITFTTHSLWLTLLLGLTGKRKVTRSVVGGLALGFLGIVMLFGRADELTQIFFWPCLALMVANFFSALGVILAFETRTLSYFAKEKVIAGIVIGLISYFMEDWSQMAATHISPAAIVGFVFTVFMIEVIGYPMALWVLKEVSHARGNSVTFINPMVAVAFGAIFGERLPLAAWLAIPLIFAAAFVLNLRTDKHVQ